MKRTIEELFVFGKAQISAFSGGIVDYLIMIFLTEYFGIHYIISIAIGGIIGAFVNFTLNRRWTFRTKGITYDSTKIKQMLRFVVVLLNSIVLKSSGTYLFTTFMFIDYKISRIITDLIVSVIFNYTLQRRWVFKKDKIQSLTEDSNKY